MKNCTYCKYAEWKKTSSGKLHPSGDGRCTYEVVIPKLPASKRWATSGSLPMPTHGFINRREELKEDCVYFSWSSK